MVKVSEESQYLIDCIVNLIVYKHMHKIVNTNHTKNLTTNYIKINFLIRNNPNDFKYKY